MYIRPNILISICHESVNVSVFNAQLVVLVELALPFVVAVLFVVVVMLLASGKNSSSLIVLQIQLSFCCFIFRWRKRQCIKVRYTQA